MGQDPPHLPSGVAAMRPSLRFLAVAVIGWAGIRAATLGMVPGAEMLASRPAEPTPPAIQPTQFAAIEPIAPAPAMPPFQPASVPYYQTGPLQPMVVPVYYSYPSPPPVPPARAVQASWPIPEPRQIFYPASSPLDEWPLSRLASAAMPPRSTVTEPMQTTAPAITAARLDRIQLTMWALLRNRQGLIAPPNSLASGGTLGGSQAGPRLFYNFSPRISAVLRTSSQVGRRGGEIGAGVRVRPLSNIPVWVTAERRQALGKYGGGRSAFALFAEGGVYDRPMPWGFRLDGYAQAGVVGLRSRDLF